MEFVTISLEAAKEALKEASKAAVESTKKIAEGAAETKPDFGKLGGKFESEHVNLGKLSIENSEALVRFGSANEVFFCDEPTLSRFANESTTTEIAKVVNTSETMEFKLEKALQEYFEDLQAKSEFPDTLTDNSFDISDMEKLSPDETALMREEFDDVKASLKRQWEERYGQPWPKYKEDVYSANGKLIRKAGSDYDAHHIQPLGLGGKNEASNITPLHAEVHYDKQGIHSINSPYSRMDKLLGGVD